MSNQPESPKPSTSKAGNKSLSGQKRKLKFDFEVETSPKKTMPNSDRDIEVDPKEAMEIVSNTIASLILNSKDKAEDVLMNEIIVLLADDCSGYVHVKARMIMKLRKMQNFTPDQIMGVLIIKPAIAKLSVPDATVQASIKFSLDDFYNIHTEFKNLTQQKCTNILTRVKSLKKEARDAKDLGREYIEIEGIVVTLFPSTGIYDVTFKRFLAAVGYHGLKEGWDVRGSLAQLFDFSHCHLTVNKNAYRLVFPGCEWLIKAIIDGKIDLPKSLIGSLYQIVLLIDFVTYLNTDKTEEKYDFFNWVKESDAESCSTSLAALRNTGVMGDKGPTLSKNQQAAADDIRNFTIVRKAGTLTENRVIGFKDWALKGAGAAKSS